MRTAIVTGASSGMGKIFALKMCERRDIEKVIAIARNEEKLELLRAHCPQKIEILPLDLSRPDAYKTVVDRISSDEMQVVWLINNAGYGKFCCYDDLSPEESANMVDLNCRCVLTLTLGILPFMKKDSKILNLSSAASFGPLPGAAVYAASKAFVRNYTRALARELKKSGITATAVCPYWTKTDFFARVHQHTGNKLITKYEVMYDAEKVVDKAIKDAEKGKDMSVYGALNKLQHVAIKLLPQALIMTLWQRRQHLDI